MTPVPTCYRAERGCYRSNGTGVLTEIRRENVKWAHASPPVIQGHRTDTGRPATYDFLLVVYSNHRPVSYRFRDKRRFRSSFAFFLPHVFNAPAEGISLEFSTAMELKKLGDVPTRQ